MRMEVAVPGQYRVEAGRFVGTLRAEFVGASEVEATKRAAVICAQTSSLEREMAQLKAGTEARNREVYEELEKVEASFGDWEEQLRREEREADASRGAFEASFASLLEEVVTLKEKEAIDIFETFHGSDLPLADEEIVKLDEQVLNFSATTVPTATAAGDAVATKIQKAHDTFDIDNAKIMAADQKLIATFRKHAQRTAQNFEDEKATASAKYFLLTEDIDAVERTADRHEETHATAAHNAIRHLQHKLQTDCINDRQHQDNQLLDSMIYSQHMLQASVLKAFGTTPDNKGKQREQNLPP